MKNFILALALLSSAYSLAAVNPYSELKPYRTYFAIMDIGRQGHHWDVYFDDADLIHLALVADSSKELRSLTKNDIKNGESWGGIAIGPDQGNIPPLALCPMVNDIEAVVRKFYPNARRIRVVYSGHFGTVSLAEVIPTGPLNLENRLSVQSLVTYKFDDFSTLESYGVAMYGAHSLLQPWVPSQQPKFVDYQLPKVLEGKSLLLSTREGVSDPLREEWKHFVKSVEGTVNAINTKTYKNPLSEILERQGNSLLPQISLRP